MEPAFEFEDLLFAGEGACGAHGLEAGIGAAGGEPHLLGAGDGVDQLLGQFHRFVVGGEESAAAFDGLDHGPGNGGVGVAQDHRTGPHEPIDVLVAADVEDAGALAVGRQEIQFRGEGEVTPVAARQVAPRFFQ